MGGRRGKPFRFFFISFLSKILEKQLLFLLLFCTMQSISIVDPLKKQLLLWKNQLLFLRRRKAIGFINIYDADLQHHTAVRKAIALFAFLAIRLAGPIFGLSRQRIEHVGDAGDSRLLVLVENLCIDLSRR